MPNQTRNWARRASRPRPLADSKNLEVLLPADCRATNLRRWPQAQIVVEHAAAGHEFRPAALPGGRWFSVLANVVLMGSSRASIHKPQICLTAQGWKINDALRMWNGCIWTGRWRMICR
jgi:hypothetical protein